MKAKLINDNIGKDIIITLPANIDWNQYNQELEKVKDYKNVMNFKVTNFPKESKIGSKCYLNYRGFIIGWMKIVGFEEKEFKCSTTGKLWKGKFIQRSGPFNKINPVPMKGFRGFKYMI
ncbi:MAG: hypothetical protein PHF86_01200 [Candidatus Nanoarchaeia archaeon]|nr:hypothetical protein [Candidatus Nanoarchaeia archaeon]